MRRDVAHATVSSVHRQPESGIWTANRYGPVTEITDWHDLAAVRDGLDGEYTLGADLDRETPGYGEHVAGPAGGWEPLGDLEAPFTGTFDGAGHGISGLVVDRPATDRVGLLGVSTGTVRDVAVADAEITGAGGVGTLVGENRGTVAEVSAREVAVTGGFCVGGLVGFGNGTVADSVVCEADLAGRLCVGGVVGESDGTVRRVSVRDSRVTGSAERLSLVGGLVGRNNGAVVSSSARGRVTGHGAVGGIVGGTHFRSEVRSSWTAAAVAGEHAVGGVAGTRATDSTIAAAYWNTESAGTTAGVGEGSDGVTGLRTDEMCGRPAAEYMGALDFEGTWTVTDPDRYPRHATSCRITHED